MRGVASRNGDPAWITAQTPRQRTTQPTMAEWQARSHKHVRRTFWQRLIGYRDNQA